MRPYTLLPVKGHYDYIGQFHEGRAFVRNNTAEFRVDISTGRGKRASLCGIMAGFRRKNLYITLASGKAGPLC